LLKLWSGEIQRAKPLIFGKTMVEHGKETKKGILEDFWGQPWETGGRVGTGKSPSNKRQKLRKYAELGGGKRTKKPKKTPKGGKGEQEGGPKTENVKTSMVTNPKKGVRYL